MNSFIDCLLVDDDHDDQELFLIALEETEASVTCHTANNGCEALDYLRNPANQRPDVIFLDLNMPRMGGKDCLKQLKADTALNSIPVVIFTTSSDPTDIAETKRLGAESFITKPPHTTDLVRLLNHQFKQLKNNPQKT